MNAEILIKNLEQRLGEKYSCHNRFRAGLCGALKAHLLIWETELSVCHPEAWKAIQKQIEWHCNCKEAA